MTLSATLSASPAATSFALPFGAGPLAAEGVLGAAVADVSAVAIASGLLVGLLALLVGLLRAGRSPVRARVPVRVREPRRRTPRARR